MAHRSESQEQVVEEVGSHAEDGPRVPDYSDDIFMDIVGTAELVAEETVVEGEEDRFDEDEDEFQAAGWDEIDPSESDPEGAGESPEVIPVSGDGVEELPDMFAEEFTGPPDEEGLVHNAEPTQAAKPDIEDEDLPLEVEEDDVHNLLIQSAETGDVYMVDQLLREGADVNQAGVLRAALAAEQNKVPGAQQVVLRLSRQPGFKPDPELEAELNARDFPAEPTEPDKTLERVLQKPEPAVVELPDTAGPAAGTKRARPAPWHGKAKTPPGKARRLDDAESDLFEEEEEEAIEPQGEEEASEGAEEEGESWWHFLVDTLWEDTKPPRYRKEYKIEWDRAGLHCTTSHGTPTGRTVRASLQLFQGGIRWGSWRDANQHWTLMAGEAKKQQLRWMKPDGSVAYVWRRLEKDGRQAAAPPQPAAPPPKLAQQPQPRSVEQTGVHVQILTYGIRRVDAYPEGLHLNLDLRHFRDPAAGVLKDHNGYHPEIMARLVEHEQFIGFVKRVRWQFEEAVDAERKQVADGAAPQIRIGLYCNAGRHRSVAFGLMLKHVLDQEACAQVQLKHLTITPCDCIHCRGLGNNEEDRRWALRTARDNWVQAGESVVGHAL